MFSQIDDIIFPDRCEVIIMDNNPVYPIFKNGSSSLLRHAEASKHKILVNNQIQRLSKINIILREPEYRFLSGINSFIFNLKKENPKLDLQTILYFAENYLFLNRHYAPQLSWLMNLNRFSNKNAVFHLQGMEDLAKYTPLVVLPEEKNLLDSKTLDRLRTNIHKEMYIRLDNVLLQLVGQKLTFKEIVQCLKEQDSVAYSKLKCIALD
jgi:hypothetical protein